MFRITFDQANLIKGDTPQNVTRMFGQKAAVDNASFQVDKSAFIGRSKDWEEVAYYMVLIVLMVMIMDSLSGWLRRRLIKGDGSGH